MTFAATQTWFGVEPDWVVEILSEPTDWLAPFARMAVALGERAGNAHASRATASRPSFETTLLLVAREPPEVGRFGIVWETRGLRAVGSFSGEVAVRAAGGGSIVAIEGTYSAPSGSPEHGAAVRVGTEESLRALLREMRTAVEGDADS